MARQLAGWLAGMPFIPTASNLYSVAIPWYDSGKEWSSNCHPTLEVLISYYMKLHTGELCELREVMALLQVEEFVNQTRAGKVHLQERQNLIFISFYSRFPPPLVSVSTS